MSQFLFQFGFLSGQTLGLPLCGEKLLGELSGSFLLLFDFAKLGFQCGDLTGFIVAAAVQLLFQQIGGLGIGCPFFAGGNQRSDAAFQSGILRDG